MKQTRSNRARLLKGTRRVYTDSHYRSNDGMLTTVWGPGMWHYLHTMSFNYPVAPTCDEKRNYQRFVLSLQHVLPCGKCRRNLRRTLRTFPLTWAHMKSRDAFSKYVYELHEKVNHMLHKESGLSYSDVRERYEHFRARCEKPPAEKPPTEKRRAVSEKGCTEPLYGEKAKCVLKIVPQTVKCDTLQIDRKCIKTRGTQKVGNHRISAHGK
jgi:Erv1 / Alr family